MTDCNRDPLSFSTPGPRAVVADLRGGRLTTDAGALLLREVAHQQTGWSQRIFGSLGHAASTRDRPRRVLVKAEHGARGANPRSIVANVPGDPQELYGGV